MRLLVINGPNLNMLGRREPAIYGAGTYADLCAFIQGVCREENIGVTLFQSNHEGAIVDVIQQAADQYDGIAINPAAYTHTSIAILDALKAAGVPAVEVHLSDISKREAYRRHSYVKEACVQSFCGLGFEGYRQAVLCLKERAKSFARD